MSITGQNIIGQENSSEGSVTYKAVNPASGEHTEHVFTKATTEEVNKAVEKASKAYKEYKKKSPEKVASFLDEIATQIEALGEQLVKAACAESGLPEGRITGERGRTCNQLRMFARLVRDGSWVEATIDTAIPDRQPLPKADIRKVLESIGPVVVFGASNFPLAFSTAGGDTASALAGGNPVIVKGHPSHPATSELVGNAIRQAAINSEMPDGVFSLLQDNSIGVGVELVKHPSVKAVGFTGSLSGGRALFDLANKRETPIPVYAEMGSVNPVLILPEALKNNAETLAKTYAGSITLGVGQFCTNPGLIIGIENEDFTLFANSLSEALQTIQPATMLNQGIKENFESGANHAIDQAGVEVLCKQDSSGKVEAGGVLATVSSKEFLANPILHEEIFGPYSLLVKCANEEDLLEVVKVLNGQLTGTIMAEGSDLSNFTETIDELKERVGRLILNNVPTGVEVCGSMHHGGPYPSSTNGHFTSVGTAAIKRFVRPVCYQNWPDEFLPISLQNSNPLGIWRTVNDQLTKDSIS